MDEHEDANTTAEPVFLVSIILKFPLFFVNTSGKR
jgi:hypothetical protein